MLANNPLQKQEFKMEKIKTNPKGQGTGSHLFDRNPTSLILYTVVTEDYIACTKVMEFQIDKILCACFLWQPTTLIEH